MRTTVGIALLVALLVLSGISVRPRPDPSVSFGSQVRETTVDTNGNGLFDQLQIVVTLQVNVSGLHIVFFEATAPAPNGPFGFATDLVQENYSVGSHSVPFTIWGPEIWNSHLDGPYNVTVTVDGCGLGCSPPATLTYQTHAYRYTQFDPPYAFISGPITDFGRDTNGDGYYDLLVVDVPVTVNQSTELATDAYVDTGWYVGENPVSGGEARTYSAGTHVIELTFDGRLFYSHHASGPYTVTGGVRMVGIAFAGGINHTTAAYFYGEFQRPDADFAGVLTYETIDTNGNGKADLMRIHVPLRVTVEADFILQSDLGYGYLTGTNAYRAVHLTPGLRTVDLDYNGIALNRLGFDGPWYGNIMVERLDGPAYDSNQTSFLTPAYREIDFESRPVSTLQVNVTVPGCSTNCLVPLLAYDPSNGFLAWSQPNSLETLPLYDGTFELLVDTTQGSIVRTVTISGNTQADVLVAQGPVDWANQTYNFVTLNETVVTTAYTTWGGAPRIRFYADLLGNHDGVANSTELAQTEGFYSNWHNTATVALDGEAFPLSAASLAGVTGEGPVTVAAPVTLLGSMDFRFPELPSPSFPKNITIWMPWTPPYYRARYDFKAPSGSVATLTTGNRGEVTRISSTEWTVTPAAVSYDTFPPSLGSVLIEVTSVASGQGGLGPDTLPILLVLVAVPVAAVVVAVMYLLWRRRRRTQGVTPPSLVEPPPPS